MRKPPVVCLVNPPLDTRSEGTYEKWAPHLGLGYLSAYLLRQGVAVNVIDAKFEGLNMAKTLDRVRALMPSIVGITLMTEDYGQAALVARGVKEIDPSILVIAGGPHPSAEPARLLQDELSYDIAACGEGEFTLHEIAVALREDKLQERLGSILGIAYRADGQIVSTPTRGFLGNLDELPFPAWHLFPVTAAPRFPLITGRGCPYKCTFCQRPYGDRARFRSVENVLAEVAHLVDTFGCRNIVFFDETFSLNRDRVSRFLEGLIARGHSRVVQWDCETRVDRVDLELLKKMKEAGCNSVGFGIESGNEEILKVVAKGITKEQARNAVKWAKAAGLEVQTYFILGYPFETEATANETIRFARELDADSAEFSLLTPLPGTQVAEMARQGVGGLHLLSQDYRDYSLQLSRAMELEGLPLRKLKRLQLKGYLSFYLRPKRFLTLFRLTNIKRWPRILRHYARAIF